jgi:serine protease Do
MNYSDHDQQMNDQSAEDYNQPIQSKPQKQKPSYFGMVISGVVGGVVVALIGVLLLTSNVIPLKMDDSNTAISNDSVQQTTTTSNSTAIPTVASEDNASVTTAIQKSAQAVVGVKNIQQGSLFTGTQRAGTGSGVIYKKEDGKAYIVTNNHVVEGAAEVEVILHNGETVKAKILGKDELTDLAVLQIDGGKVEDGSVATFGSSEKLMVGETVIAIGNPLGMEFAGSVTKGIISGLERSVEIDSNKDGQADWTTQVIQTDAAINPGNSGGALVNTNGKVIGINSMKIAQAAVEGIGFAIPISTAKPIIKQLETNGEVSRPLIGISAISLSKVPPQGKQETLKLPNNVTEGVVIAKVQSNSPADDANLQRYDVITKINDQAIKSMLDLRNYLYREMKIGDEMSITYYREGQQQKTTLTLAKK